MERNLLVVFTLFVYDKMFAHAPLQRLFEMEIFFISISYLMFYIADRVVYFKYHNNLAINSYDASIYNNNHNWTYIKKTVTKYRLWLNWSIASFCMILAAISGAIIAFIYFNSSIIKDVKSFIPTNIEYRATEYESSIKEQHFIRNDLSQLYETRLSGLEKDVTNQNTMFSQQISVLTALYNNSLMVFSIIIGLMSVILIFFGWVLNRKFDHERKKITEMSRNVRKVKKDVESSLTNVTNESEAIVDGLKKDIDKFINNSEDKLYHQYEKNRRDKIINSLKENPELINVFYPDMVLNISEYKYRDLNEISMQGLFDKTMLAKYRHLKLINSPSEYLKSTRNVRQVVCLSPRNIVRSFFSYDIAKQVIELLTDSKNIKYKKNIILFIKGLVIQSNSYLGGKILSDDSDMELLKKILAYDCTIFDDCIKNRVVYLTKYFSKIALEFENRIENKIQPIIDAMKNATSTNLNGDKS